jgi:hypothetical protein
MSFDIPPQADASNLLDQNCDDFFSGPGFVTLSTPVLPRHLTTTALCVKRQDHSNPRGRIWYYPRSTALPTHSTTEPKHPTIGRSYRRRISHPTHCHSPPPNPFIPPGRRYIASVVGSTSKVSPRPLDRAMCRGAIHMQKFATVQVKHGAVNGIYYHHQSDRNSRTFNQRQPRSLLAIQRTCQNTQIPRRPPIPVPQKKNKGHLLNHVGRPASSRTRRRRNPGAEVV